MFPPSIGARTYYKLLLLAEKLDDNPNHNRSGGGSYRDAIGLSNAQASSIHLALANENALRNPLSEMKKSELYGSIRESRKLIHLDQKQREEIQRLLEVGYNYNNYGFKLPETRKSALVIETAVAAGSLLFATYWCLGSVLASTAAFSATMILLVSSLAISLAVMGGIVAYFMVARAAEMKIQNKIFYQQVEHIRLQNALDEKTAIVDNKVKTLVKKYQYQFPQLKNKHEGLGAKLKFLGNRLLGVKEHPSEPELKESEYDDLFVFTEPETKFNDFVAGVRDLFFQHRNWTPFLSGAVVAGSLFATYWGISSIAVFGLSGVMAASPVLTFIVPLAAAALSILVGVLVGFESRQAIDCMEANNEMLIELEVGTAQLQSDVRKYEKLCKLAELLEGIELSEINGQTVPTTPKKTNAYRPIFYPRKILFNLEGSELDLSKPQLKQVNSRQFDALIDLRDMPCLNTSAINLNSNP